MKKVIQSGSYSGRVQAPASKSYLQRAVALAFLADGTSVVTGFSPSQDAQAAIGIVRAMGAGVIENGNELIIKGTTLPKTKIKLDCGESGLSARMFSPIAALMKDEVMITGSGSLLNRPMDMVSDALTQLGKHVESTRGRLPLKFQGTMHGAHIQIDGSETSQLLTGLLIALSQLEENSIIEVKNPKSIPYVQMTLDTLAAFGVHIQHENFLKYYVTGRKKIRAIRYAIEGDWSGAAFHLVAAAISGNVTLENLSLNSAQADRAVMDALEQCGAKIEIRGEGISVERNGLRAFCFDATHCPDLFPPLAVLASCCGGKSEIKGVTRLRSKESDRAAAIQTEFGKLGIQIEISEDSMFIQGGIVTGGLVQTHQDHRMSMALAILGLVSKTPVVIEGADCVNKSYPGFFDDFEMLTQSKTGRS